jgi:ankyrin repeat protein
MSDPITHIAELLLESRASYDVRDKNPETPLHLACRDGKARLLID